MSEWDDDPWRRTRAGRLDESHDDSALFAAKGSTGPHVRIRALPSKPRRFVPLLAISHREAGSLKVAGGKAATPVRPFHYDQTFVSRRPAPTLPPAVLKGARIAIWPTPEERAVIARLGGVRHHRKDRAWSVHKGHPLLRSALGTLLTSEIACVNAVKGRVASPRGEALRRAIAFSEYIAREGEFAHRAVELVHDTDGPIVEGTLGRTATERAVFWRAVDQAEHRVDGRLQERHVIELPHWFSPADFRETLRIFGRAFDAHGIAWLGAVHKPDPHGDPRNTHLHIVTCPRPVVFWEFPAPGAVPSPATPHFAPTKDRRTQGPKWISMLREEYARVVNELAQRAAQRDGTEIPWLFHPGSNAELGIEAIPGVHRGTRRSAIGRRSADNDDAHRPSGEEFRRDYDKAIRQAFRSFDKDRDAFLALCDRLVAGEATPSTSRELANARATLISTTDAAANTIGFAERFAESVLGNDEIGSSDFSHRPASEDEMVTEIIRRAKEVRDAVARAHLTEREYIRQLELARRAVEEQRRRAIDQAKPSAPSIAPPLPAERESPPTIDTQRVASGNPLARAITPLRKSGEPQELGPFVLAALASDIRTPRLFAWLRESVRRSETEDIVAALRRLDALSKTQDELGPAFARARAELNAAMFEDRRWRGPEPRVSSASATPRTPPRASIEPRMSPEAEAIKAGPFPNPKYAIRVADDEHYGTKRDEMLIALQRLPTDALELLHAHTRAAFEHEADEFRLNRSIAGACRALALKQGAELLDEIAQSRGVRLGGAAMAQALHARPNRDGGRER